MVQYYLEIVELFFINCRRWA